MDAYIAKLEKRISALEGQMAAMTAALYANEPESPAKPQQIYIGTPR
jgi:hypothetical protein